LSRPSTIRPFQHGELSFPSYIWFGRLAADGKLTCPACLMPLIGDDILGLRPHRSGIASIYSHIERVERKLVPARFGPAPGLSLPTALPAVPRYHPFWPDIEIAPGLALKVCLLQPDYSARRSWSGLPPELALVTALPVVDPEVTPQYPEPGYRLGRTLPRGMRMQAPCAVGVAAG